MTDSAPLENGILTQRGEYKQPGGKLVAVGLCYAHEQLQRITIDGDFFIDGVDDPGEVVHFIEKELMVVSCAQAFADAHQRFPEAQFVGLNAKAVEIALKRAQGGEEASTSRTVAAQAQTVEDFNQLSPAWSDFSFELLDDSAPHTPAEHMALDEIIARQVAQGTRPATLRFWQWAQSAVIIGLHQSVNNEVNVQRARELGFSVVRRMTGGGAMFVEPGNTITYSLYVPSEFLTGVRGYEAYKRCDEWVLRAFGSLGIRAGYKPINDITSAAGKIGGAAQRKFRAPQGAQGSRKNQSTPAGESVLHHVTMAYDIDASKMLEVLKISREKQSDKAVKSAAKRVDPLKMQTTLTRDELWKALEEQALKVIPRIRVSTLDEETLEEARRLAQSKYANDEWTYSIA